MEFENKNVKYMQKERIKYSEFSNLFEISNIDDKDILESIYDSINAIDKTIKLDEFISLFLNQEHISKHIKKHISRIINQHPYAVESFNIEYITKRGIVFIEGLNKCCKNYLSIFVNNLIDVIEEEQKIKITKFNNIDFTDFKSAYKIVEILKYKFKYQFKHIEKPNVPEMWIDLTMFNDQWQILLLVRVGLAAYELLGGKTDISIKIDFSIFDEIEHSGDFIDIKSYNQETGLIKEFAEQTYNFLRKSYNNQVSYYKSLNVTYFGGSDHIIYRIPELDECKQVVELISEKSEEVIKKYKKGEFSKYSIEERQNEIENFMERMYIDHAIVIRKFLKEIELLTYFKRHNHRSAMICNLCKYGLLDEDLKLISTEIIIEVCKHLTDKSKQYLEEENHSILYMNAKDLFN